MRLKKYFDFLTPLNESKLIFSDKFKQILKKIDSPVATRLLEIEGEDLPVTNNYFDLSDNKNQITFISDRKAQEILNIPDSERLVTHTDGGFLRHSDANSDIFSRLNYTPEGDKTYHPQPGEQGKIVGHVYAPSGKIYCKVVFPGGISVINNESLKFIDLSKEPFKKSRQPGRVGATIQNILRQSGGDFSNQEVEQFVNKYKSEFDRFNDAFRNFELVSGMDIHHWYQSTNYLHGTSRGQLSNSCMGRARESWLEIYTQNPDVCQLLILKDDDQQDKIKGRALVWKLTQPSNITYVDRIYTHDDSDLELFKQYIKEQGWYLKSRYTSSTSDTTMIAPDGSESRPRELIVKVNARDYSGYPYLDTFKFYTPSSGRLNTSDGEYQLEDTGGGYSNQECDYCGGDGYNECGECNGRGNIRCGECDGNRTLNCPNCDGDGSIQCSYCDGEGQDGEGNPCEECNGKGTQTCEDCNGDGNRECPECDGNGRVQCDDCDGEGQNPCSECNW